MKKLVLLIISCLIFLTSCMEDNTQLAKDEFSKYFNGKNEVVLVLDDTIYFETYQIDLNSLKENEEANNGLLIKNNKIYFSMCRQNSIFNYTLNIYESDFSGKKIDLIFSKDGYKTHPWAYAVDDSFYIEHYSKSAFEETSKQIDVFILSKNQYENIDSGKDCSLSNYLSKEETNKYEFTIIENPSIKEHGKFIITNTETNEERIIDDEYLKNTIYIESMEMFNYAPNRVDISNGHILLTYGIGAGDGWTYPHLVFEYDFENDALEYKLLVFPFDSVPIEIIYIE